MSDLYNWTGAWPHNVGVPADDVPRSFGLIFNIPVAGVDYEIDLADQTITALITNVQSVFIDNDTAAKVVLQVATGSRYRIIAKSYTQGWYPILMQDNARLFLRASAVVSALPIMFSNVQISAGPWSTQ